MDKQAAPSVAFLPFRLLSTSSPFATAPPFNRYICVCVCICMNIYFPWHSHTRLFNHLLFFLDKKEKTDTKCSTIAVLLWTSWPIFWYLRQLFRLNVAPWKPNRFYFRLGCSMMTSEFCSKILRHARAFFIITFCFRRNRPESVPGPLFMEPKHFGQFLWRRRCNITSGLDSGYTICSWTFCFQKMVPGSFEKMRQILFQNSFSGLLWNS